MKTRGPMPQEQKDKISASKKKYAEFTPEHREALRLAAINRKPASPETREKMSAFHKARWAAKRAQGETARGPMTEEHKATMSESLKGKPKSPEHRAKIAEGVRRRNALKQAG